MKTKMKEFCLWAIAMLIIATIVAIISMAKVSQACLRNLKKILIWSKPRILVAVFFTATKTKKALSAFFKSLWFLVVKTIKLVIFSILDVLYFAIKWIIRFMVFIAVVLPILAGGIYLYQPVEYQTNIDNFYQSLKVSEIKIEEPKLSHGDKEKFFKVLEKFSKNNNEFNSLFKSVTYQSVADFKNNEYPSFINKMEEVRYSSRLPSGVKNAASEFLDAEQKTSSIQQVNLYKEVISLKKEITKDKVKIVNGLTSLSQYNSFDLKSVRELNKLTKKYGGKLEIFNNKFMELNELNNRNISISHILEINITLLLLISIFSIVLILPLKIINSILKLLQKSREGKIKKEEDLEQKNEGNKANA